MSIQYTVCDSQNGRTRCVDITFMTVQETKLSTKKNNCCMHACMHTGQVETRMTSVGVDSTVLHGSGTVALPTLCTPPPPNSPTPEQYACSVALTLAAFGLFSSSCISDFRSGRCDAPNQQTWRRVECDKR
jgi:hypothetical protein